MVVRMMIREAHRSIRDDLAQTAETLDWSRVEDAAAQITASRRIFVMARGRSELVLRMFAMRLMHMGKEVHVVGDTTAPAITKGDLLIVASASGETETVCRLAEKAKGIGAVLAGFVGRGDCRLAQALDAPVVIKAPSMRDANQTQFGGSLFEQSVLILCDAVVVSALAAHPEMSDNMKARHANLE